MAENRLEQQLSNYVKAFRYPATPDLAAGWRRQARPAWRRAWALALVVLAAAALAAPPVRAQLAEWLQIGAVQIQAPEQTLLPATPDYTPAQFDLEALSGATTLAEARARVNFSIPLPAYPPNWGEPDRVFLQAVNPGQHFAILVWGDEEDVELVLYVLGRGVQLIKGEPQILRETQVNGRPAAWLYGGHLLVVQGLHEFGVLVSGPTLVWEGADGLTYRLEANLPIEEMLLIAESIE